MFVLTYLDLSSSGFKQLFNTSALTRPQKILTVQSHNAEVRANMSSTSGISGGEKPFGFPKASDAPGEQFEPRQTATSEDYTPDASKSISLSPARQRLVDDVRPYPLTFVSVSRFEVLTLGLDHRTIQLPTNRRARKEVHG